MREPISARRPHKCPICNTVWEDWQSSTIRRWPRNGGDWVWRELRDFPTIGCDIIVCPECGNNPKKAEKVASGVC